ncbi:arylsulfatase B-like isoform X3 [Hermetia illucens]|nr:arylsulfatase B-like isoform X3 [Hermetia illucens]
MCTPSRSALLTGKYPMNIGMQHYVIPNDEPWGLPLKETIMPEILKKGGYSTYLVGKWHQGFHKRAFTPTMRGFDYHFGYYGGYIDYYQHYLEMIGKPYAKGYDMRRNFQPIANETSGRYATDLFTDEAVDLIYQHDQSQPMFLCFAHLAPHTGNENDPLQAPPETIAKFQHIKDPLRRTYAAMIDKLDESIGRIIEALYDTQMLHNSIVLFYSDNGAPSQGLHSNSGSNYPFRGQKDSPWEGGLRTPAAIWSPYLMSQHNTVANTLIHVTDWLPTLAAAAGINIPIEIQLDGKNIWDQLQRGYPSPRWNIVHNIDEIFGYSSYSTLKWKLVNGSRIEDYNGWLGSKTNESDPRAEDYVNLILNSTVNEVMSKLNAEIYMKLLTKDQILALRKSAIVDCPTRNLTDAECNPSKSPCLFDIENDPCERYNLADRFPQDLERLKSDVEYFRLHTEKPVRVPADPACDPRYYNLTWTWWQDLTDNAASPSVHVKNVIVFVIVFVCISILF